MFNIYSLSRQNQSLWCSHEDSATYMNPRRVASINYAKWSDDTTCRDQRRACDSDVLFRTTYVC